MDKGEYLKNLKVGDTVTRFFHGAGFITQGEESEVVFIKGNTVWIEEWQEEDDHYTKDSVYAYSLLTGKQSHPSFGMFHTIELPDALAPDRDEEE